jgi:hypothetical protein
MSLAAHVPSIDSGRVSPTPQNQTNEAVFNRRDMPDRRRRFWWSVAYGSFNPRRRLPRRIDAAEFHLVDWHHSRLLAVVMAIMLLCVSDAFLTLVLLQGGAREANPVMASVVYRDATTFTILKMLMTSSSVAVMVLLAGYRFLGVFRVEILLYLVLTGYICLVAYELWMMSELGIFPMFI